MTVTVSSKYQVVIPENIRTQLQLKPGTQMDVIQKGQVAYLVPVRPLRELQKQLHSQLDTKNLRDKKERKL